MPQTRNSDRRLPKLHRRGPGYFRIKDIPCQAEPHEVKAAIACIYHSAIAQHTRRNKTNDEGGQRLMNFRVTLHEQPDHSGQLKSYGSLLLPCWAGLFQEFTRSHPVRVPYLPDWDDKTRIESKQVKFIACHPEDEHEKWSKGTINHLKSTPWIDPRYEKDHQDRLRRLDARCQLTSIQFGFDLFEPAKHCGRRSRLNVHRFCVERAYEFGDTDRTAWLHFLDTIHMIQIQIGDHTTETDGEYFFLKMRYETIRNISRLGANTLIFALWNAPVLEYGPLDYYDDWHRSRLSGFDPYHERVMNYFSRQFRIGLYSEEEIELFILMAKEVGIAVEEAHPCLDSHDGLGQLYGVKDRPGSRLVYLSDGKIKSIDRWLHQVPFRVAFQVAFMVYNGLVNPVDFEMTIRPLVEELLKDSSRTVDDVAEILIHFSKSIRSWTMDDYLDSTLEERFRRFIQAYEEEGNALSTALQKGWFWCFRATITPTSLILAGPSREQSNGVIRKYEYASDCFLRVSFMDEDRLQLRCDRGVDGVTFVKERIGEFLKSGIDIAGYHYDFLGYSNSGLKQHTVWFVRPFLDCTTANQITAEVIRQGISKFSEVEFMPAKLGARLAQAFSTTESSIILESEEIQEVKDIDPNPNPNVYHFTDGYGCISLELASEIWKSLNQGINPLPKPEPAAYQVRIGGAKGVLGINPLLKGRKVLLHKSMVKFQSSDRGLHIALKFDHPLPLVMNRPLVAVLEHLGVDISWFVNLQEKATGKASNTLLSIDGQAADYLMERSVGRPYGLPDIIHYLAQHGITRPQLENAPHPWYEFLIHSLSIAVLHIEREIKYKARIPVPDGHTLVGVADVHGELPEGHVYICIQERGKDWHYFPETPGIVYVTRSPSIHYGDVQRFRAEHPPKSSIYWEHPMRNCIVFSTKGTRPGASMLGGGDLDGDLFQIIPAAGNFDVQTDIPAEYQPVKPSKLKRRATINDIADFVVDFINSDRMGIIATQHLIISDQSRQGLHDPKCVILAELHSRAVDFQKTGKPVTFSEMPKKYFQYTPDYQSKEAKLDDHTKYYESPKALGVLYRRMALRSVLPWAKDVSNKEAIFWSEHPIWKLLLELKNEFFPGLNADEEEEHVKKIFNGYVRELKGIRGIYTIGNLPLSEAEVFCSIIMEQTPNRRREDMTQMLRDAAVQLVEAVCASFRGHAEDPLETWFARSLIGVRLSFSDDILRVKDQNIAQDRKESQCSFGMLALRCAFDCLEVKKERRPDPRKPKPPPPPPITPGRSTTTLSPSFSSLFTSGATSPSMTPMSPLSIGSPLDAPLPATSPRPGPRLALSSLTSQPLSTLDDPESSPTTRPRKWANSRLRR